ncbi:hypothetical protein [Nesterenkonia muleiensis]|uniref:hypothetical protein n=1 Tax=Nesterenkonia muleiensis TaxID=2282648 RepID=UPI000E71A68D|nr:hypothetical protein [Nesterenkonia muleiensis]
MPVSIYAYRTLIWVHRQNRDDVPASIIPEDVLPTEERLGARDEMNSCGWLAQADEALAGGPDFTLSNNGKRRARRWKGDYTLRSAQYTILHAIPTEPNTALTSAEDAFWPQYQDPVTGESPSTDLIEQAAEMLYQDQLVTGSRTSGPAPFYLELTQNGRAVRREHYVPSLSAPELSPAAGASTTNQFNANISGGTFGAAQFGQNNQATVGDVHSELNQQFQTLRELANSQTAGDDRQEVLEQINQLEAAARQGSETFETMKNSLLSGFASKLGDRAVSVLLAIPPLLAQLNG